MGIASSNRIAGLRPNGCAFETATRSKYCSRAAVAMNNFGSKGAAYNGPLIGGLNRSFCRMSPGVRRASNSLLSISRLGSESGVVGNRCSRCTRCVDNLGLTSGLYVVKVRHGSNRLVCSTASQRRNRSRTSTIGETRPGHVNFIMRTSTAMVGLRTLRFLRVHYCGRNGRMCHRLVSRGGTVNTSVTNSNGLRGVECSVRIPTCSDGNAPVRVSRFRL